MTSDRALLAHLLGAIDDGDPVVLVTVVATSRSVPRHAGSKMLVRGDLSQIGTIGGGEMESRVIDAAAEALTDGRPRHLDFDLVDPGHGDPGICGGSVSLYLEPFMPEPNLVVVGCGHVGTAVAELAHWLGFRVTVMDDRPDLASAERVPTADVVLSGPIPEALAKAKINEETHVVVVTRNMEVDLDLLPVVVDSAARSIGVMGSRRRWDATRDALIEAGIDEKALDRVISPIGLDIHAETPHEIALSILGEIVQLRQSSSQPPKPGAPAT